MNASRFGTEDIFDELIDFIAADDQGTYDQVIVAHATRRNEVIQEGKERLDIMYIEDMIPSAETVEHQLRSGK